MNFVSILEYLVSVLSSLYKYKAIIIQVKIIFLIKSQINFPILFKHPSKIQINVILLKMISLLCYWEIPFWIKLIGWLRSKRLVEGYTAHGNFDQYYGYYNSWILSMIISRWINLMNMLYLIKFILVSQLNVSH